MKSYRYVPRAEEMEGNHRFLAEELLQPFADRTDVSRTVMFTSHFAQCVTLNHPDRPRVFTRFENRIGDYSSAIVKTPVEYEIVDVFEKNPLTNAYALMETDGGRMHLVFTPRVKHLTESFGYRLQYPALDGAATGDTIPRGSILRTWPCRDNEGSFRYGRNLKTFYTNDSGKTYEDGIIISESAAEKMTHTAVHRVSVMMNVNDFFVNIYGDKEEYKGFPDIGETIERGILAAVRRIDYDTVHFDVSEAQIRRVNFSSDRVFYLNGEVVDIDVFCNLEETHIEMYPYHKQVLRYVRKQKEMREWILDTFGEIVEEGTLEDYTEDVAYHCSRARMMDDRKWLHDGREFNGIMMVFTIAESRPLMIGSKLTNRYGGKGVVSEIRPDRDMPFVMGEPDRQVEIIINSLSVINRLNPSQLFELDIGFMADEMRKILYSLVETHGYDAAWEEYARFMRMMGDEEPIKVMEDMEDEEGRYIRQRFIEEITEGEEAIHICQPPFFGNLSLEGMHAIYKDYSERFPGRFVKVDLEGRDEPAIIGDIYYMKLKHEPAGKLQARSARHLTVSGIPTKNTRFVKGYNDHHSSTPIRMGEQEIEGLYISGLPDEVSRFLRMYSTDEAARRSLIDTLLTGDPFTIGEIEFDETAITRTSGAVQAYLENIGMAIVMDGDDVQGDVSQTTE